MNDEILTTRIGALLFRHEGLRLMPYRDSVAKLTIGVGRNLDDRGISREEAVMLLDNDIRGALSACRASLPWFDGMDQTRQAAIVDVVFNLGMSRFLNFHKALAAMAAGDWETAANELLDSKWASQVGIRAKEISEMIRSGSA